MDPMRRGAQAVSPAQLTELVQSAVEKEFPLTSMPQFVNSFCAQNRDLRLNKATIARLVNKITRQLRQRQKKSSTSLESSEDISFAMGDRSIPTTMNTLKSVAAPDTFASAHRCEQSTILSTTLELAVNDESCVL